jgi:endonuclease/exonuclease/phosphatase family metal-dependent hydrolase
MKFGSLVMAAICLGIMTAAQGAEPFRVMSYNICNTLGIDKVRNVNRIVAVITNAAPDFVLLQELDVATKRSKGIDLPADIATRAKMHATFGAAIHFKGGQYGVCILSKTAPLKTGTVALPGREERRVLLWAEFPDVVICCTHLSLTAADSLASVKLIDAQLDRPEWAAKPVLIGGDFNSTPDSPTIVAMKAHWTALGPAALTFPSDKPSEQIDYLFGARLPASCKVLKAAVIPEPVASDHRPIFVELAR